MKKDDIAFIVIDRSKNTVGITKENNHPYVSVVKK